MQVLGKKSSKSKREQLRFREISDISHEDVTKLAATAHLIDERRHKKRRERTRESASKIAVVMGISPATFYRRQERYAETGLIAALERPRTSGGRGKSRLDPAVEEIIQRELKKFRRKSKRQPIAVFVVAAEKAIEAKGFKVPDRETIRNRFESLTKRAKYAHVEGSKAASDKFNILKGSTPECLHPMERTQTDHTPGDVWIVSADRKTKLGRPQTTFTIDEFSRIPMSIHVSLADPNTEEFAESIALAVLPKDHWLDHLGLCHMNFPFFGMMNGMFLDHAAHHKGSALKAACTARNIHHELREQTHHGGIIERLIGTAMVKSRTYPGSTILSTARRREDKVDPSKFASMTMKEYLKELVQYFWGEYTFEREHPALGMTPAQKWVLGCQTMQPRQVADPFELYLDFLPSYPATCQRYGVQVKHLRYNAPEFQEIVNDFLSEKIVVKIDPADISRAFVRSPTTGKYIELRNHEMADKGITRSQWTWHVEEVRKSIPRSAIKKNKRVTLKKILFHIETGRLLSKAVEDLDVPSPVRSRSDVRRADHNADLKERSAARLPRSTSPTASAPPVLEKLKFVPFELG